MLTAAVEGSDSSMVTLSLQNGGGTAPLGQYGMGGTDLRDAVAHLPKALRRSMVLQVPADLLLERAAILPLAAEQDLKRVVGYELDRLTPFRADEVLWTCTVDGRDTARNQLHVRITIALLLRVQPVLTALQQAGLYPARIEARAATGPRRGIPLGKGPSDQTWLDRRIDGCALAGCGLLAVIAVAMPFAIQSVAGARIDAQIEAARPQSIAAERLLKMIASGAATSDAITAARDQAGTVLQAIALLTDVLPDDTFLTLLSARQRKLAISGRSTAAARLIGLLTAHPLIHHPSFTTSVVRDETSGGELFSIGLDFSA